MGGLEDDAYARRLFAILTTRHPTGIDPDDPYGQADDGIDRHDGFGRGVWVTSVEVEGGELGAELLVEFALALPSDPDWRCVPKRGTLRLPLDAEWREQSGYGDPAAYAPAVAREVEIAAHRHVERHRSHDAQPLGGEQDRPVLPSREEQWQILLRALRRQGDVREVAAGRIEIDDSGRTALTVVVSPDQWECVLLDHAWGDVDLYFDDLLGPRQDDEVFVVFCKGDLARSTRQGLPPVRGRAFEREIAEARPASRCAVRVVCVTTREPPCVPEPDGYPHHRAFDLNSSVGDVMRSSRLISHGMGHT